MTSLGAPVVVLLSFGCGAIMCALFRYIAVSASIVNHPNPIVPQHDRAIAYLGGVGIAFGAALAMSVFASGRAWGIAHGGDIVMPALLMLVVGTVDDIRAFTPMKKFLLQALVAAIAVAGGAVHAFAGVFWLDALISWLWIVAIVNAFNLTDVCDGLVAGLSIVSFVAIALLFPAHAIAAWVMAGACLGFMLFNRPDATMFMGDGGSHFLGALIALLLLRAPEGNGMTTVMPLALLVGVPLFELAFLIVVRTRKGLRWWRGSPDHFSLRLQRAGYSKLQTDLMAWGAAALLAVVAAVGVSLDGAAVTGGTVVVFVSACVVAGRALVRLEAPRG